MSKIDVQKSIVKGRITHKYYFYDILNYIINSLFFLPIVYIFSWHYFEEIDFSNKSSLIIPILTLSIIILFYSWIYKNQKLLCCKNIITEKNKINIDEYLKKLENQREWFVRTDKENLKIIDIPMWEIETGWYNKLILIFNGHDLLINFSSKGRIGTTIPFFYYCFRNVEKKFAKKILEKIENAT